VERKFSRIFLLISGLLLASLAFFAESWGLDYHPGWGRGRSLIFVLGLFLILLSLFFRQTEVLAGVLRVRFFELLQRQPIRNWLETHPTAVEVAKTIWKYQFVIPAVGFVLIIYVWFVSLGLWTTWPARSAYYSLLARGFLNHELSLPVEPSKALLALPNPYDPVQHISVEAPPDFSLYKGKFYLYWGPVPALILAAIKMLIPKDLPDLYLVFGFSCGLFLWQTQLVISIWDRYFRSLPKWILVMLLLLVGLSVPSAWMLGRAEIYEAAIIGGQFFVMAGFSAALSAVMRTHSADFKLLLAGISWSLAIGTRLTLILPVSFLMLMVIYQLCMNRPVSLGDLLRKALYLGSPVVIGLGLLAWYNWARFGSLSETGFTYQLAGVHLQEHLHEVMSYKYFIQNIYNYFLVPPQLQDQFPFIFSNGGSIQSVLPFLDLPDFYGTNPVTGLIYTVPFIFFSVLSMFKRNPSHPEGIQPGETDAQFVWLIRTLSGGVLIALVFLLVFFWVAMRYVLDFMPMLMLLSIIGYCQGYTSAKARGWERYMAVAGIVITSLCIVVSPLLGISSSFKLYGRKNPSMLNWFIELFG